MSAACVRVVRPGLQTTVQDEGRWGAQSRGVSVSGAMDAFAHRAANALVGNPRSAATFEVTLIGPELTFEDERVVAVTGATFDLTVDDRHVPNGMPFIVTGGATLRFGARTSGARAYLAIAGGVDVPLLLGSRATHVPSRMGGWQGRALAKDDRLPLGDATGGARHALKRTIPVTTALPNDVIRVIAGPDAAWFPWDAIDFLQTNDYTVASDSDRMGYRLTGARLPLSRTSDMISTPTPIGSLQVTASGAPVLLMADRQTAGGYPRVATAISADLTVAAQKAPGDTIRFRVCDVAEARQALVAQESRLLALEADVR